MSIERLVEKLRDDISLIERRHNNLSTIPAHDDVTNVGTILLDDLSNYLEAKKNHAHYKKSDILKEDILYYINESMIKLLHVSPDLPSDRYWGLIAGEGGKPANTEQFVSGLLYVDALVEAASSIKAFKDGLYQAWKKTLRSQVELSLEACEDRKVAEGIFKKENLAKEPYNFKSLPHKLGKEQLEQLRELAYVEIQNIRHEFFMKYESAHQRRSEK